MQKRWKPSVTVAAVIERDGRFLLVEEERPEGLLLNNPAGHLEPGETPTQGVIRETMEETAHPFTPVSIVGVYLSTALRAATTADPGNGGAAEQVTYLRFAFAGTVGEPVAGLRLDDGIVRWVWMTLDEVRASASRHRSPAVLRCIEDYLSGRSFPLDLIHMWPDLAERGAA